METTWLDITEILNKPVFTGIQRIERELIQNWDANYPLVPVAFDRARDHFIELPQSILSDLLTPGGDWDNVVKRALDLGIPTDVYRGTLVNLELFFCRDRLRAYVDLARAGHNRIFWVVMDFLPHLQPEHFYQGAAKVAMPYLRALREIPHVGFISRQTKIEFADRISRSHQSGPVLLLGGDSLDVDSQHFSPERKAFLTIGTIEPRKQHAVLLEAFDKLWRDGFECELHVVGEGANMGSREKTLLAEMQRWPQFHFYGAARDELVAEILPSVRATIFTSQSEGFGLPPYESLAVGVPVVCAAKGIPSLSSIPENGQVRLDEISASAVSEAVIRLLDDEAARQLWDEAAVQKLPTWRDFAGEVRDWLDSDRGTI